MMMTKQAASRTSRAIHRFTGRILLGNATNQAGEIFATSAERCPAVASPRDSHGGCEWGHVCSLLGATDGSADREGESGHAQPKAGRLSNVPAARLVTSIASHEQAIPPREWNFLARVHRSETSARRVGSVRRRVAQCDTK